MAEQNRFQQVEELFQRARALEESAREAFLRGAGVDNSVIVEVKAMLAHDASDGAFLDKGLLTHDDEEPMPESIGDYRVLGVLGRGGMGVVYRAEQDNPRRTVALKVVGPGLWHQGASRRLEKEAQALGRLHHPSIAQVYEAGTFPGESGPRPFFAMELVEGEPLDKYVEANKLGVRERLEMIAKLCDAMQHAHDAGIVHRDLKPGNVLVNDKGEPKILDFGVARLTEADVNTVSLRTDAGALVGTVPYMSPEQAAGDPTKIGTRSDIYSLGVLAYELLALKLPYAVRGKLVHEAVRVIREDDPDPLSSASKIFRGDVETIVGKALEKEPDRRYQSAAEFGEDIRRHLTNRTITARPPSTAYQLAKFYRRNRALVTAVVVVMLALAGATVWSSVAAVRASDARAEAERQARIALATNTFMHDYLFSSADPWESGDPDRPIREVLARASADIEGAFPGEPVVEASVRETLGEVYNSIGLYEEAEPHLRRAVELFERELGVGHETTLDAYREMGVLLTDTGLYSDALEYRQRAYDGMLAIHGEESNFAVSAMSDLAVTLMDLGRFDEAEELLERADGLALSVFEPDNQSIISIKMNLGACLFKMGRIDEAAEVYVEAVDVATEILGPTHPETIGGVASLALVRQTQGRNDEAAELHARGVAAHVQALGADHSYTLTVRSNYALFLGRLERFDESESLHNEILEVRLRTLGERHPDTAVSWALLAQVYGRTDRPEEALDLYAKAYDVFAEVNGPTHPYAFLTAERAARVADEIGRPEEAERWRALVPPVDEEETAG